MLQVELMRGMPATRSTTLGYGQRLRPRSWLVSPPSALIWLHKPGTPWFRQALPLSRPGSSLV